MVALPCAAAAVMWLGFAKARYGLRRQVPGYLRAGRSLFAQKDYEAALREYNKAIHAAPELAEAYCRRSLVYHEMGQTRSGDEGPGPRDRLRSASFGCLPGARPRDGPKAATLTVHSPTSDSS